MKKLLIGCGIVVLLIVVVVGAIGFLVAQSVRGMFQMGRQTFQLYADVNKEIPFKPPATNALSAVQVDRWLAVRKAMLPATEAFKGKLTGQKSKNPLTVLTLMTEQSSEVVKAHADALRAHKMSATEYFWIARRVITVLHGGDALKDPDLKSIADAQARSVMQMRQGGRGPIGPGPRPSNMDAMFVPMTSQEIMTSLAVLKSHKKAMLETNDLTMLDSVGWGISEASLRERNAQSGRAASKPSASQAVKPSGDQATTTATTATQKPAPQKPASKPVGAVPGFGLRAGVARA
jgi:hypothetical protein